MFRRSLRRRSASSGGPGALPLDPDLPPPANLVVHAVCCCLRSMQAAKAKLVFSSQTSPPKTGTGLYTHHHQHYHLHDDPMQLGREYSATSPTSPVSPSRSGRGSRSYGPCALSAVCDILLTQSMLQSTRIRTIENANSTGSPSRTSWIPINPSWHKARLG